MACYVYKCSDAIGFNVKSNIRRYDIIREEKSDGFPGQILHGKNVWITELQGICRVNGQEITEK